MSDQLGPVVMIGLDGAEWPLVERWAAAGELPTLARLMRDGTRGRLRTPEGFNDNAVWASFATGRQPERHGWWHFNEIREGGYDVERTTRDHIDGRAFWEHLSDAGRTVTVLDAPKSPVGRGLRGVQLVDWLTHGQDSPVPLSDPPGFADEVVAAYGSPHPRRCLDIDRPARELPNWLDDRIDMARRKGDLSVDQLGARDADLVVTVLGESHCVGHQCWHLHDPAHPYHDPALVSRVGDPLLAIHRELDDQVARIVEAAGPEATIVVFACLGMGPNDSASGALDAVLARLDRWTPSADLSARARGMSLWHRLVPPAVRRRIPRWWQRVGRAYATRLAAAMRRQRSYFPIDCGSGAGGVRLNVVGREEAGVIEPGAYERTLADVEAALGELVDTETGESVVAGIERPAETRDGPYVHRFPDLMVHWSPGTVPVRAVRSPRVGTVEATPLGRTGDHRRNGFFVAAGPGVGKGMVAPDADIVDLAPTISDMLGAELTDVDGHPIPALARNS